MSVHTLAGK
jgi:phosphoribosyl-AMP cyclohydrolase